MTDELQARIGASNSARGFHQGVHLEGEALINYLGNKLLLVVSEVVEAQEELRHGHDPRERYYSGEENKPEGFISELADVIIRVNGIVAELEETYGQPLSLAEAVEEKLEFNGTRPFRHGGKAF